MRCYCSRNSLVKNLYFFFLWNSNTFLGFLFGVMLAQMPTHTIYRPCNNRAIFSTLTIFALAVAELLSSTTFHSKFGSSYPLWITAGSRALETALTWLICDLTCALWRSDPHYCETPKDQLCAHDCKLVWSMVQKILTEIIILSIVTLWKIYASKLASNSTALRSTTVFFKLCVAEKFVFHSNDANQQINNVASCFRNEGSRQWSGSFGVVKR